VFCQLLTFTWDATFFYFGWSVSFSFGRIGLDFAYFSWVYFSFSFRSFYFFLGRPFVPFDDPL